MLAVILTLSSCATRNIWMTAFRSFPSSPQRGNPLRFRRGLHLAQQGDTLVGRRSALGYLGALMDVLRWLVDQKYLAHPRPPIAVSRSNRAGNSPAKRRHSSRAPTG